MTEEQAKTKWCPFARVEVSGAAPNRHIMALDMNGANLCIGSDCMAWRKDPQGHWHRPDGTVILTETEPYDGRGHWVNAGFCGLAGQP